MIKKLFLFRLFFEYMFGIFLLFLRGKIIILWRCFNVGMFIVFIMWIFLGCREGLWLIIYNLVIVLYLFGLFWLGICKKIWGSWFCCIFCFFFVVFECFFSVFVLFIYFSIKVFFFIVSFVFFLSVFKD